MVADQTGGVEPVPIGLERNPGAVVELGAREPARRPALRAARRDRERLRRHAGRAARLPPRQPLPAPDPQGDLPLRGRGQGARGGERLRAARQGPAPARDDRARPLAAAVLLPRAAVRLLAAGLRARARASSAPCSPGPKIKADGLAGIREPVCRYLRTAGYLGPDEEPEVLVVRPSRPAPGAARRGDPLRSTTRSCGMPDRRGRLRGRARSSACWPTPPSCATASAAAARRRRDPRPRRPDVTGAAALHRRTRWSVRGATCSTRGRCTRPTCGPRSGPAPRRSPTPTTGALACHLEGGEELEVPVRHTAAGESSAALQERAHHRVPRRRRRRAGAPSVGRYLAEAGLPAPRRATCARDRPRAPAPRRSTPTTIWTGQPATGLARSTRTSNDLTRTRKPQPKTRRSQQHDRRPDRRRLGPRRAARRSRSSSGPTSTRRPARTRC